MNKLICFLSSRNLSIGPTSIFAPYSSGLLHERSSSLLGLSVPTRTLLSHQQALAHGPDKHWHTIPPHTWIKHWPHASPHQKPASLATGRGRLRAAHSRKHHLGKAQVDRAHPSKAQAQGTGLRPHNPICSPVGPIPAPCLAPTPQRPTNAIAAIAIPRRPV